MNKKTKNFIILLLSAIFTLTIFSGCDKPKEESSGNVVYAIEYHIVYMDSADETVIVDYKGSWDEYWLVNLSKYKEYEELPKTYIAGESTIIPSLPIKMFNLEYFTPAYSEGGKFTCWFLDENCTQKFDGKINGDCIGDLQLYASWSIIEAGPF